MPNERRTGRRGDAAKQALTQGDNQSEAQGNPSSEMTTEQPMGESAKKSTSGSDKPDSPTSDRQVLRGRIEFNADPSREGQATPASEAGRFVENAEQAIRGVLRQTNDELEAYRQPLQQAEGFTKVVADDAKQLAEETGIALIAELVQDIEGGVGTARMAYTGLKAIRNLETLARAAKAVESLEMSSASNLAREASETLTGEERALARGAPSRLPGSEHPALPVTAERIESEAGSTLKLSGEKEPVLAGSLADKAGESSPPRVLREALEPAPVREPLQPSKVPKASKASKPKEVGQEGERLVEAKAEGIGAPSLEGAERKAAEGNLKGVKTKLSKAEKEMLKTPWRNEGVEKEWNELKGQERELERSLHLDGLEDRLDGLRAQYAQATGKASKSLRNKVRRTESQIETLKTDWTYRRDVREDWTVVEQPADGKTYVFVEGELSKPSEIINWRRDSAEGMKLDRRLRKGLGKNYDHAGHMAALRFGVHPEMAANLTSQNASMNMGAGWGHVEGGLAARAEEEANHSIRVEITSIQSKDENGIWREEHRSLTAKQGNKAVLVKVPNPRGTDEIEVELDRYIAGNFPSRVKDIDPLTPELEKLPQKERTTMTRNEMDEAKENSAVATSQLSPYHSLVEAREALAGGVEWNADLTPAFETPQYNITARGAAGHDMLARVAAGRGEIVFDAPVGREDWNLHGPHLVTLAEHEDGLVIKMYDNKELPSETDSDAVPALTETFQNSKDGYKETFAAQATDESRPMAQRRLFVTAAELAQEDRYARIVTNCNGLSSAMTDRLRDAGIEVEDLEGMAPAFEPQPGRLGPDHQLAPAEAPFWEYEGITQPEESPVLRPALRPRLK